MIKMRWFGSMLKVTFPENSKDEHIFLINYELQKNLESLGGRSDSLGRHMFYRRMF